MAGTGPDLRAKAAQQWIERPEIIAEATTRQGSEPPERGD
jgi:hypothetical protein